MKKRFLSIAFMAAALFCTTNAEAQKTEKLFNGKNLSNWDFKVKGNTVSPEEVFSVKDGMIQISGQPFGYMHTKEKYGSYKLHVEWKWVGKPTNSGIFLLIEELNNPFPKGIEAQLCAGKAGDFVLLGGSDLTEFISPKGQARPAFPVVQRKVAEAEKPAGEWNEANVYVKNGVVTVFVNGIYQNTGTSKVKEGYIGLQSEGGPILFRNVTITQ